MRCPPATCWGECFSFNLETTRERNSPQSSLPGRVLTRERIVWCCAIPAWYFVSRDVSRPRPLWTRWRPSSRETVDAATPRCRPIARIDQAGVQLIAISMKMRSSCAKRRYARWGSIANAELFTGSMPPRAPNRITMPASLAHSTTAPVFTRKCLAVSCAEAPSRSIEYAMHRSFQETVTTTSE